MRVSRASFVKRKHSNHQEQVCTVRIERKETELLNLAGKNLSINNLLYLNAHLLFDITTHNSEINRTILKSALGILGAVLI